MKKILIIQTASIGDVILATPLLENLHAQFPEARIDLLVKKGTQSLFSSHPFLGQIYVWDKSEKKLKNFYRILKEIQSESEVHNIPTHVLQHLRFQINLEGPPM